MVGGNPCGFYHNFIKLPSTPTGNLMIAGGLLIITAKTKNNIVKTYNPEIQETILI